ncbi:BPSS1780 family membrane protein [Massilia sp. TSP1-1-2]|uniref:BPSS1780 family membrane protein n=1 Tax=unclassified Massilia TaxID=2609279 RepID=UPI003CFAA435
MHTEDGIVTPDKVTTIRHVDINRGIEWIAAGFNLFMKKPGELIIAGLVLFIVTFILQKIPLVGSGLATMLGVLATGALMLFCRACEDGQDVLAAAQKAANITPLWMLALIAAGMGVAIAFLGSVLGAAVLVSVFASPLLAMALGAISLLLMMLLSIPVVMALWLAPALVVLKGTAPVDAIRLSFAAAVKNFPAFIIFYVLSWVATFVGSLPLGIGLIFVYPVVLCATYMAYKEIFATAGNGEAVGFMRDAP